MGSARRDVSSGRQAPGSFDWGEHGCRYVIASGVVDWTVLAIQRAVVARTGPGRVAIERTVRHAMRLLLLARVVQPPAEVLRTCDSAALHRVRQSVRPGRSADDRFGPIYSDGTGAIRLGGAIRSVPYDPAPARPTPAGGPRGRELPPVEPNDVSAHERFGRRSPPGRRASPLPRRRARCPYDGRWRRIRAG